jgi:hypothetical protein
VTQIAPIVSQIFAIVRDVAVIVRHVFAVRLQVLGVVFGVGFIASFFVGRKISLVAGDVARVVVRIDAIGTDSRRSWRMSRRSCLVSSRAATNVAEQANIAAAIHTIAVRCMR